MTTENNDNYTTASEFLNECDNVTVAALNIDLEAIKARAEAATPGPWVGEKAYGIEWLVSDLGNRVLAGCRDGWGTNAEFIAAAREDVPALVAEIERLTGEPTEGEIGRAGDALAEHEFRVTDWYPCCTCGWRADHAYDVSAFDRHVARVALRAARGLTQLNGGRDHTTD